MPTARRPTVMALRVCRRSGPELLAVSRAVATRIPLGQLTSRRERAPPARGGRSGRAWCAPEIRLVLLGRRRGHRHRRPAASGASRSTACRGRGWRCWCVPVSAASRPYDAPWSRPACRCRSPPTSCRSRATRPWRRCWRRCEIVAATTCRQAPRRSDPIDARGGPARCCCRRSAAPRRLSFARSVGGCASSTRAGGDRPGPAVGDADRGRRRGPERRCALSTTGWRRRCGGWRRAVGRARQVAPPTAARRPRCCGRCGSGSDWARRLSTGRATCRTSPAARPTATSMRCSRCSRRPPGSRTTSRGRRSRAARGDRGAGDPGRAVRGEGRRARRRPAADRAPLQGARVGPRGGRRRAGGGLAGRAAARLDARRRRARRRRAAHRVSTRRRC